LKHAVCCVFDIEKMTFKCHSRSSVMLMCYPSLDHLELIRARKNRQHLFTEKIAEMTVKIDQCHW